MYRPKGKAVLPLCNKTEIATANGKLLITASIRCSLRKQPPLVAPSKKMCTDFALNTTHVPLEGTAKIVLQPKRRCFAKREYCVQRRWSETTAINHNWAKWEGKISGKTVTRTLRGSDCKYRESVDRLKKSKILITCQKNTFGELSSKILFKLSGNLLFSRNSEKRFCLINYAKIRLKTKQIACACF